jgi:hypothetical protein
MTTTSEPTVYGLTFYQIIKMREYFVRNGIDLPDPNPKKKVVRRLYMMAYQSEIGWMVNHEMVGIDFRDIDGVERFPRTPRKILENSPFIDVEAEE